MIILKPLHVKKTYSSTVFLRDVLSNANEQKKPQSVHSFNIVCDT